LKEFPVSALPADPADGASPAKSPPATSPPAHCEPPAPAEGATSAGASTPDATSSIKILTLRREDLCACGAVLEIGQRAGWDRTTHQIICLACLAAPIQAPAPDTSAEPMPPTYDAVYAWQFEMSGDRRLASTLASLGTVVFTMDDRWVPESETVIEHVVVGPAGVYLIEAKLWRDPRIAMRRTGGALRRTESQLMVNGKDRTELATAMDKHVNAARAALERSPDLQYVPLIPVLCFVDGQSVGNAEVGRVRVRDLGGTANLVVTDGPFDEKVRADIHHHLAEQLPGRFDTL